jgi:predicted regulator of Ras-like GTPase activity (Roadblock/LC7/MglB family)
MNSDGEIKNLLEDLKNRVNLESAVIRKDGRLLCSNFELDFHSNEIFGAMSTTMLGAAKNISAECRKGYPERIIIDTGDSHIIITNTQSKAFLMCMTNGVDNIQGLMTHIDKAVERLNQILQ